MGTTKAHTMPDADGNAKAPAVLKSTRYHHAHVYPMTLNGDRFDYENAHHTDADDDAKAPQRLAASSTHQEDATKNAEAARPWNNGRAEALRRKDLHLQAIQCSRV